MTCPQRHSIAYVQAGHKHPKYPWGYVYMHYCWVCGVVTWSATQHTDYAYTVDPDF